MQPFAIRATLLVASVALLLPAAPVVQADPPSHAPAHGWRKKHDPYYHGYSGKQWGKDYDILQGKCNREAIGTVLGGVAGGAIGSTVGKGDGKTVAIILGTVIGAVIGNRVGKELDESDRGCIGHALELAPNNRTVSWRGDDQMDYRLTPLRDYTDHGMKCREYRLHVNAPEWRDEQRGRACLTPDGNWQAQP